MTLIRGGIIGGVGGGTGGSATQLGLSDGLACYTASFSGITTSSFTHGLGTTDILVEFKDSAGNLLVPDNWQALNNNTVSVEFAGSTTGDLVVLGCIPSGAAAIAGGVNILEGLSGIIDLDSPNGSITISTSGQVINLNALFTPASGAVLQQKCADIDTLSGLIVGAGVTSLNNLSGVITLASPDDSVNIVVNGQTIELTTPGSGAPSGASYLLREYNDNGHLTTARILSATSGIRLIDDGARSNSGLVVALDFDDEPTLNQVLSWNGSMLEWVDQTGGGGGEPDTQTSINGLSGTLSLTSPDGTILIGESPQTIELSGLFTQASGAVLEQKCEDLLSLSGTIDGVNTRLISLSGLTDGLPRTQTSIEGVSGVVGLEALDGTMVITVDGQTIQLSGLFNPSSGEILEQKCRDIDTLSGIAVSTSGVVEQRIDERRWQGVISGLELSINSSNSGLYDIAAGVAYVSGIRLEVPAQSGIDPNFLPGSGTGCGLQVGFVGLSVDGSITTSIDAIHSHEEQATLIDLGLVTAWDPASANSGLIQFVHTERQEVLNIDYNRISWVEFAVGAVVSSGIIVSDNGSLTLATSDGVFYDRHQNRRLHELDVPLEFFEIYRGSDGVYRVQTAGATLVNNTQYDSGFGLTNITGNRWVSHTLWFDVVRDNHFMVISNDQYTSLQLAQDAPLNPGCIVDFANVIPIAQVIIQRNQTVIGGSTGRIIDRRPIIGARDAGGVLTTSATTLQQAYENSIPGAEITLTPEQGGVTIADNAAALAADGTHLFEVHNNDESIEFFQVNGSGIYAPSGIFEHKVGIGGAFPQGSEARCTLDVSGLICASGLEIVGTRPIVSGIGVATLADVFDAGQTSINNISGVVTLGSPDESVNINVNGQSIELTTPGSGAPSGASYLLREYNDNDHLTDARILSATSGVRLDDQGARSNSGLVVTLDFENEPTTGQVLTWNNSNLLWADQTGGGGGEPDTQTSINGLSGTLTLTSPDNTILIGDGPQSLELSGLFTQASGALLEQKCEDIDTVSGVANSATQKAEKTFTPSSGLEFVLEHGLATDAWVMTMWRTDSTPQELLLPDNIYPSGSNHAVVTFQSSDTNPSGYAGRVVFVG